jgi:hypothetical protein
LKETISIADEEILSLSQDLALQLLEKKLL